MPFSRYNCLFVDDEPGVLDALRRSLRKEPFQCRFAGSGDQALDMLAEQPADVVVSDMRMPEMSGSDLLKIVAQRYPQSMRLVLSGWADPDDVLNAINDGRIFRYIVKPWDDRELKSILRQALEMRTLQDEKRQLLETLQRHNRDLEKRVEERTAQLLKIRNQAEIGKYASQIVHDLNNPLYAVTGIIDLLRSRLIKKKTLGGHEISEWLDMAKQSTKDLKSIISGILLHARDQTRLQTDQVDLNALIEQEIRFFALDHQFKDEIETKISLDEELPQITGHPVQLKQVIDNLIRNAWDAMADSTEKQLTVNTMKTGKWIVIEFIDSGQGITEEHIDLIFRPDFSTKPVGQGTGLGLASTRTMVESYAGTIDVASIPGAGTTFKVKLPAVEPPPDRRKTETAQRPAFSSARQ